MKCKIIVCTHKRWDIPNNDIYMPLHVGKALTSQDFGYQGDDTGENISIKNKNFCELTGLYWGWKNLDVDYIGTCHYRRYFDFKRLSPVDFLGNYDMVLPTLHTNKVCAGEQLMNLTTREDFYIWLMSIMKTHPEYKQTLIYCLFNTNKCSGYNMMFCKKEVYDDYCKCLFSIFDEMEKWTRLSGYSRLARLYGFLSEYFPYIYCRQNRLKIKYTNIIESLSATNHQRTKVKIVDILKRFLFDITFRITNKKHLSFPITEEYDTNIVGFKNDKIPYIDSEGNVIVP